ncbi:hypothetical protein HDV01_002475 [Terramyces sp. JEL0728]|nr:hypothetical protein HDV01_002475 [Terramyces sp. JEL0728]
MEREVNEAFQLIQKYINISSIEELYCFEKQVIYNTPWYVFDPRVDFARMGLGVNTNWRISTINEAYNFSSTYPRYLGVPQKISDNTLRHIGKFRSKSRIPALSYIHKNQVTITRSAQPMIGLKQNRSIQDEKLIEAIFNTSTCQSDGMHLIIDARPLANALAQTAMGAGTENSDNYQAKIVFLGIENIHVVRDSLNKLYDACVSFDNPVISKSALERSGWLKHIKNILDGTLMIVQSVHVQNEHTLVHCSDGWDRTAQLSSLAQVCLDPYYRTIDGFQVLLEKEWISFGHKFQDRCGHLSRDSMTTEQTPEKSWQQASKSMLGAATKLFGNTFNAPLNNSTMSSETSTPNNLAPKEISPVFLQFLDCMYQIWTQYPTEFEYDQRLLEFLFISAYSCQFGNFLFNNERELRQFTKKPGYGVQSIEECTVSLWQYLQAHKGTYYNAVYTPSDEEKILFPNTNNLKYWSKLYKLSTLEERMEKAESPYATRKSTFSEMDTTPRMENEPQVEMIDLQDASIPSHPLMTSDNPWQ